MLVLLFSNVNYNELNEIYTLAVRELRNDGVANDFLRDPREIGLDDILEMIHARKETNVIRFEIQALSREVERQIPNYHHLLWSLIDSQSEAGGMLLKLIELSQSAEHWQFRRDLGAAIGRLGIYHTTKLRDVLETLAKHPVGGVVATAGYALDAIGRNKSNSTQDIEFVSNLIQEWVESGDPDLKWAAGASIWRVYDGLVERAQFSEDAQSVQEFLQQIRDAMTKLGQTYDQFNAQAIGHAWLNALESANIADRREPKNLRDLTNLSREVERDIAQAIENQITNWASNDLHSTLHAIRQIAKTNPQDIVKQITDWLAMEEEDKLYALAKKAAYQLFDENGHLEIQLIDERHRPLLELIGPLLSTDQNIVNTMLSTLLIWSKQDGWTEKIYEALLYVVNRGSSEDRKALRAGLLNQWIDDDSEDIRRIGQSLIRRSYIMDGIPVDMPGHHYGVMALDASYEANINSINEKIWRELHARLNSQIDIKIVRMGTTDIVAQSGDFVSASDSRTPHDYPRLLIPFLENLNSEDAYFVLVLTWQQITDYDDVFDSPWFNHLIILDF